MKPSKLTYVTAIVIFATLATPVWLAAQQIRYKLVEIPTLGGPSAHGPGNGPGSRLLSNAGTVAGTGS